jgi:hypothetical protein
MNRQFRFISILLVLISAISCVKKQESNTDIFSATTVQSEDLAKMFEIHLQHGFENSPMKIWLDGEGIYNKTINTNYVLSLAEIKRINIKKGLHNLKCSVEQQEINTNFFIQDTLVIGIYKDFSTGKFNFIFYKPPNLPLYD